MLEVDDSLSGESEPSKAWLFQRSCIKHVVQFGLCNLSDETSCYGVFEQGIEGDALSLVKMSNGLQQERLNVLVSTGG